MPKKGNHHLLIRLYRLVCTSHQPELQEAPSQGSSKPQIHVSVLRVKEGGQVGVFQLRFSVFPNRLFLSGARWATLWEVVVLASIRGQLQCSQFWHHGKWSVVIIRAEPIHLLVEGKKKRLGRPRWRGLVFSTFMDAHFPCSHQACLFVPLTFFIDIVYLYFSFLCVFVHFLHEET